jgi:hypothetical protein
VELYRTITLLQRLLVLSRIPLSQIIFPVIGLRREVIYDLAYYAYGHGGIDTVLILETRNPTPLRISYYSTDSACTDTVAKASSLDAVVDTFVY